MTSLSLMNFAKIKAMRVPDVYFYNIMNLMHLNFIKRFKECCFQHTQKILQVHM